MICLARRLRARAVRAKIESEDGAARGAERARRERDGLSDRPCWTRGSRADHPHSQGECHSERRPALPHLVCGAVRGWRELWQFELCAARELSIDVTPEP